MALPVVTRERVTVIEFGPPVEVELAGIDPASVTAASEGWRRRLGLPSAPFVVQRDEGRFLLSARHITGVLRVSGLDVEIVPKFLGAADTSSVPWKEALWRILSLVDTSAPSDELTSALPSEDLALTDLLADAFIAGFRRGAVRGLPRAYQEVAGFQPRLRGSLDLTRLPEWIAHPWLVPCRVDELTEDTPTSRLIAWAAQELSRSVQSSRRSQGLLDITYSLAAPTMGRPSLAVSRAIRLGPQHQALQQVVGLSALLLEGKGLEHAAGPDDMGGFLWNSDEVYEKFLYYLCERAARKLSLRAEKTTLPLAEPITVGTRSLTTTPDVLFRRADDRVAAVIDAKYKTFGRTPKAADSYQIVAAAHVTGCPWVALSYPVAAYTEAKAWSVASGLGARPIVLTALPLLLMKAATREGTDSLSDNVAHWVRLGQRADNPEPAAPPP